MNFIDLKSQYNTIADRIQFRINTVLEHGAYILGPEVTELESQLAAYNGSKHCIGLSSGTDALLVALMVYGIKPGDEVITTSFSFFSTAAVIVSLGAKPVFVDIDERTYNLNPDLIEAAITPRTKAIMPVSLNGQVADMTRINAIAKKHNIPVIEDAAQSFGGTQNGKYSCALSEIGCTSFYPSKPLGCYGDGGACFTDNDDIATLLKELRVHGQSARYYHTNIGINGRLDTLQAAILLEKLAIFPQELIARRKVAAKYSQLLEGHVLTPYIAPENECAYAQYTVQVDNREKVQALLQEVGIPTAVHYPRALHLQPAIDAKEFIGQLPVTETVMTRVMSLPMHPYLKDEEIEQVATQVIKAVQNT